MVQFGTHLIEQNMDFGLYQDQMINKFYPHAHIETINQMIEWAKEPLMMNITLDKLKMMLIDHATRYINANDSQLNPGQRRDYLTQLNMIKDYHHFESNLFGSVTPPYCHIYDGDGAAISWSKLFMLQRWELVRLPDLANDFGDHIDFVNLMYSIWVKTNAKLNNNKQQPISTASISFVQFNQLKQITTDLQQQLNLANQKIAMLTSEFHFEFNLLKQQNAELLRQRDNYPVATAVPFDSDETKLHFARNISAQNLSDYQA